MSRRRRTRSWTWSVAAVLAAVAPVAECTALDLWKVRGVEQKAARYAYIKGSVSEEGPSTNWIVVYESPRVFRRLV